MTNFVAELQTDLPMGKSAMVEFLEGVNGTVKTKKWL